MTNNLDRAVAVAMHLSEQYLDLPFNYGLTDEIVRKDLRVLLSHEGIEFEESVLPYLVQDCLEKLRARRVLSAMYERACS